MTNGGGEGGSQRRDLHGKRSSDFAQAVARMAVAQICESVEISPYQESQAREGVRFSSFQESALETLTDVVIQYIQNVGKTTQFYANMAGRVEGNALDIVQALEDLGSGMGFDGAPDVNHCLADSGVVKDIIRYTGEAEEMPFVYSLPSFPFNKGKRPAPSFSEVGAEPPDEHIPTWLPAFPEAKKVNEMDETNVDKKEDDVQSKETEQKPEDADRLKVQKPIDQKDVEEPVEELEGNPYLAAPVWAGERNVPPLPLELAHEEVRISHVPEKQIIKNHHIPSLEAAEMINDKNRLDETDDGGRNDGARTHHRALLRFKIGTRKASTRWRINQRLEEKGWFEEDGDKKVKVEGGEKRESIDTDVK